MGILIDFGSFKPSPITNYQHIKRMNLEEMSECILCPQEIDPNYRCEGEDHACDECTLFWLKSQYIPE